MGMTVHIGVIVSLAEERQKKEDTTFGRKYSRDGFFPGSSRGRLEILGRSLLDRTIDKVRQLPSASVRVIPEPPVSSALLPARSAKPSSFITAWEDAIAQHLEEGADQLLLLRSGTYYDLEYQDLLGFHIDRGAPLTQAYGNSGALDIAVVDADCLRNANSPFRKTLSSLMPEQERYYYDGYANFLKDPHDLRRLVEDGLQGRCDLSPIGQEISPGIWIGKDAHLHPSLRVEGPAFIGARSRIAENCTVTGSSSIERDCEIDCGTDVHQSCVLPGSYIGIGLDLNRSVISERKLFHLDRNLQMDVEDDRLIGITKVSMSAAAARGFSYA